MSYKDHITYLLKKYQNYHFDNIERENLYKKEILREEYGYNFQISSIAKT